MMKESNKRIAKNTIILYIRMIVLLLISLYTSRVVLNALGVVDYGVYNVVGGAVMLLSVMTHSLNSAITRFFTFELGKNNFDNLNKFFSTAINIQVAMAVVAVILAETIGFWFLNNYIVIPEDRIDSSHWVFHFSVLSFAISLVNVPYNSIIIAHERMTAYAYISIIEAVGKLIVAVLIAYLSIDRLIFYAAGLVGVIILVLLTNWYYCRRTFSECVYHRIYEKKLFKSMACFAGWNFIGSSSDVLRDHGGTILVNLFFGPTMNAARAIGMKTGTAINIFSNSFMTAVRPQITKSYASGDRDYMLQLIYRSAKFSFFLMLLLCLPILLNTHYILIVWLKLVPEHAVLFVQLTIILSLSNCLSSPLHTAQLATGNIRNYQIIVGSINLMNIPAAYLCFQFGAIPESVVVVAIIISQCSLAARLFMLQKVINIDVWAFVKKVYIKVIIVGTVAFIFPLILSSHLEESTWNFIIVSSLSVVLSLIAIILIGCNQQERIFVFSKIKTQMNHNRN